MQKLSPLGNWIFYVDAKDYAFIVLTSAQYPFQVADHLLADLRTKFYAEYPAAVYSTLDASQVKANFVMEITARYNKAQDHLLLPEAEAKVEDLRFKIHQGVLNNPNLQPPKVPTPFC